MSVRRVNGRRQRGGQRIKRLNDYGTGTRKGGRCKRSCRVVVGVP